MSSAFDEADSGPRTTRNILHGKDLTNTAASNLSDLEKQFQNFKKNALKSAGKSNAAEINKSKDKMSKMFHDAKFMIDDELAQSPNDRTLLRLKNDYEALFHKFEIFCTETLSNKAFQSGTDSLDTDKLAVAHESDRSLTITAGSKTMVFKTYDANDSAFIEERDMEAQKIATKTEELNALFVDVGKLVHEQQAAVDAVVQNVDSAQSHTEEGLGQLNQAVSRQKSSGKIFCCVAILLVLGGGAIAAALILT